MLNRTARVILPVVGAIALLTGCTPIEATYVRNVDGDFVFSVPDQCDFEVAAIEVRLVDEVGEFFDEYTIVWTAKAEDAQSSKEVVLFEPNDGYTTEQLVASIDTSMELAIGWHRARNDGKGVTEGRVLRGVLDEVEGDTVLWWGGVGSFSAYQTELNLPWNPVNC